MSTETLAADVLDALVDLWSADSTLAAMGVRVLDGVPPVDQGIKLALYVGGDGDPESDAEAATIQRDWAHASAQSDIDEWVLVTCAAQAWTGDTAIRQRRRDAITLFNAAAHAVRDSTLGLAPRVFWCEVSSGSLQQIQSASGCMASLVFQVRVRCRIEPN